MARPQLVCDLCDQPARGLDRLASLDVCDRCLKGDASQQVTHWCDASAREWVEIIYVRRRRIPVYFFRFEGSLREGAELQLRFGKANFFTRMGATLGMGLPSGDALFDRMVSVSGPNDPRHRSFVSSEGVQGAAMDLVSEGARPELTGRRFQFQIRSSEQPDGPRLTAAAVAFLRHLWLFERAS